MRITGFIRKLIGGSAIATALTVGSLAGVAGADSTCYTGCTTPTTGIVQPTTSAPAVAPVSHTVAPASGLAFTGADIEEMAALGLGAIVVGTVLIRSRKRTTA